MPHHDFQHVFQTLFNFVTGDLSAFYFDVRKDALYCDAPDSLRRRACRTVLDLLFHRLVTWLAPVLVFTMEEVWLCRFPGEESSVHLQDFPETPADWRDDALAAKWAKIRTARRVVTGALEIARRDKVIGASLEAAPVLYVDDPEVAAAVRGRRWPICASPRPDHRRAHPPDEAYPTGAPRDRRRVRAGRGREMRPLLAGAAGCRPHAHAGVCGRCDRALG